MRKQFFFKTIYVKFAMLFIGIWWLLNTLTFVTINIVMSNSFLTKYSIERYDFIHEFHRIRKVTGLAFFISAILGTILFLIAVRGIVKPIKRLSYASKEVSKGNFEISVEVKSKDEIGQLTSDFNLMTKELKHIEFLRKDFVSNVSHEFKTPITSIKGFAKLIREGKLSNEQLLEYSEIIIDESNRLSLLSSNLLKISELDSKMIQEQSTLFSLDEQIRKTILILEVQWAKKEIEFDINLAKLKVSGDEHLLQEVWLNLIQNAIKFSHQNGKIEVKLSKIGDVAKVSISDQGIGIAENDKERIFERFYKGDKSRSKEGNGLGLVIVKQIVELSNGKIHFNSELGKGSTFIVELPLP